MKNVKQLIIIGGGTSIKEGIYRKLWKKLDEKFTVGLNYSFRYFPVPTFQCYVDKLFYEKQTQNMKYLPLIIGNYFKNLKTLSNTIMLKNSSKYNRDISKGCYKSSLCGLYALSLGIYLLNKGEIYLLGYDYSDNGMKDNKKRLITHFYQGDIQHRGIGKVNYYKTKGRAEKDFGVYKNEKKCKIYNVSMNSKINTFPKISYDQFFKMLSMETYNQDKLRKYIYDKLEKNTITTKQKS